MYPTTGRLERMPSVQWQVTPTLAARALPDSLWGTVWSSLGRVAFRIGNRAVVRKRLEANPDLVGEHVAQARARSIERDRKRRSKQRCDLCGTANNPQADFLRSWWTDDLVDHWYCPSHVPPPSRKMRKLMDNSAPRKPSAEEWFAELNRCSEAGLITAAQFETQRKRLVESI